MLRVIDCAEGVCADVEGAREKELKDSLRSSVKPGVGRMNRTPVKNSGNKLHTS